MSEFTAPDGTVRKSYYGSGRQPWDDYVAEGWAPEICAGMVLKYLRRDKEPEHSLESARWYYQRHWELCRGLLLPREVEIHPKHGPRRAVGRANAVMVGLTRLLTPEELVRLKAG